MWSWWTDCSWMLASPRNWSSIGKVASCCKWSIKMLPTLPLMLFCDPAKQTEMWHQLFVTWHLVMNVQVEKIEYRWFKYFSITSKCHGDIKHIPDFCNCMFYSFIFSACQAWCLGQICCHRWRDHTGLPQKVLVKLMREGGWFRSMGRSR